MKNLINAMLGVMQDVKHIAKDATVGSGRYQYKGVSDAQVKEAFQQAFIKHKLVIMTNDVDDDIQIDRWQDGDKWKQSITTVVKTKYTLIHESGESMELMGYGHGIDTADKGAGKATTYALKNVLLNTFVVPSVNDDTDTTHSNDQPVPQTDNRAWLNENTPEWNEALKFLANGGTLEKIMTKYKINKRNQEQLKSQSL